MFQTCPSGNYYEYKGIAIGSRSQAAKTYLERNFESFAACDRDALIRHAVSALRGCLQGDDTLTVLNASISVVGSGCPLTALKGDELAAFVSGGEDDDGAANDNDDDNDGGSAAAAAEEEGDSATTGGDGMEVE